MTRSKFTAAICAVLAAAALAVCAAPSGACTQSESIYLLTEHASYQEGCFPPCYCPIMMANGIRGTFVMGPPSADEVVIAHDVQNVFWIVTLGDSEFEITGSGIYRFNDDVTPPVHALDLDLSVDGDETQHFSSGFVPYSSNDGSIDIPITVKEQTCPSKVIVVNASPVAQESILHYRLAADSTYQRGCFGSCDCYLEIPRGLKGTLSLVETLNYGTWVEYAVPQASFVALPPSTCGQETRLTGFGRYVLIQGFAGPAHDLDLRLRSNGGDTERFDSSLFNTEPTFPAKWAIEVDTDNQQCFDTVLSIHAVWMGPVVFNDGFESGGISNGWTSTGP